MDFTMLTKKINPTLKRIAYKLNGRYTAFDHDDLYQEALMHLWGEFLNGRLKDKTDSYILQGCYFHLKNYIRKTKSKPNIFSLEELMKGPDESETDTSFLLRDTASEALRDSLSDKLLVETIQNNGFTPKEKSVLMFLKDGMTTREIGARLGVSHVMVVKMMVGIRQKSRRYADNV